MKKTSIRQDLYLFLKNPDYNQFNDLAFNEKIKILLKVLVLTNIGLLLVNIPIVLLKNLGIISQICMKSDLALKSIQAHNISYKPYFILSIVFLVPLVEELSFRLAQTKFRINYFIISVSIISASFIQPFIRDMIWLPKSYFLFSISGFLYDFVLSALIGSFLYGFKSKFMELEGFWNNNAGVIIYTTASLFAVLHIGNLKFESRDLIFMPLILLPFLVYGLSFGYLRSRLGIMYSIALHFIFLALSFGLPELASVLKAHGHS
jgi:hypothetical protein